jgi:hypothetical protein
MQQDQFIKLMHEVLGGEIARIDFEKHSPKYTAEKLEFEAILRCLESLLQKIDTNDGPVDIQEIINNLDDSWNSIVEIGFDIGLKMGFSLAFRFIFYCCDQNLS